MKNKIELSNSKISMSRVNYFLSLLLDKMQSMTDEDRDLPIRWNIMHMYSSAQLAKLLAIKRNLDPELAAIIATLHDVAVIYTGRKERHAENAEKYVMEIIAEYNRENENKPYRPPITEDEERLIIAAVIQHSDKAKVTEEEYTELLKDVDSCDRMLHGVKTSDSHLERASNFAADFGIDIGNTEI